MCFVSSSGTQLESNITNNIPRGIKTVACISACAVISDALQPKAFSLNYANIVWPCTIYIWDYIIL